MLTVQARAGNERLVAPARTDSREATFGFRAQRQPVSALFVDVVGSMSLSETMSVEDWWMVIERLFDLLSDGVRRFEGRVECFTGDGVTAMFGADERGAGHAARACACALWVRDSVALYATELMRQLGLAFSVRIGVNSGEAVVGVVDGARDSRVVTIGHAASMAKRIESIAAPGTVYVSEQTAAAVDGAFELLEQGLFEIRGAQGAQRLFELVRPAAASARSTRARLEVIA